MATTGIIDLEALPDVPIKKEPVESSRWFTNGEVIEISDDEDDQVPVTRPDTRLLDSSIKLPTTSPAGANGTGLGQSLLQTVNHKPEPKKTAFSRAECLARQATMREKIKAKKEARARDSAAGEGNASGDVKTPAVPQYDQQPEAPASGLESGLFVTDRTQESKKAIDSFCRLQGEFEKKNRMGILSYEEEVEYLQAQTAEKDRLEMETADERADLRADPTLGGFDDELEAEALMASIHNEPKKRGRKRRTPDDEAAQPKTARKRARAADAPAPDMDDREAIINEVKKKHLPKGKAKGKKPKVSKAKAKAKGPEMTNTANLMGTDVFRDALQNRDAPDQPTFGETGVRDVAMKQMIAGLPAESKKLATVDMKYLNQALKSFTGTQSVHPAADGGWSIKGMRTTLKHYQVLGVAFMRRREASSEEPMGGILADSMGLGKTLMMLANIMNGRSLQGTTQKTTLIVAAPALVAQWHQEIKTHVMTNAENKAHGLGIVQRYHSKINFGDDDVLPYLEAAEIVLTTYSQVCKSYPKEAVPPQYVTAEQKNDWWQIYYEENKGPLHQMKFHRVVLDEAQAIKNHLSITSKACRALVGKHYWAISGTPIMNNVREFYPYFKFLREPSTASYKLFKGNFCSPEDPEGSEKLSLFLRKLMIRRTHLDRLFDAKLLTLPQPEQTIITLEFNEVERSIYDIVENRFVRKINQMSASNDMSKQYGHMWVMLTRLRQICGHIALAQSTIMDLLEREDYERLNNLANRDIDSSEESASLLMHLREQLAAKQQSLDATDMHIDSNLGNTTISNLETAPTHHLNVNGAAPEPGGMHGLTYDFKRYLESLRMSGQYQAIIDRSTCGLCNQPPDNPHVTSCFHIFCFTCLTELGHKAAAKGMDCSTCQCGRQYTDVQPCQPPLPEVTAAHEDITGSQEGVEAGLTGIKSKRNKKPPKVEPWMAMGGTVLPSAKTIAVKAQIMNWIEMEPDVKIIIYTQFLDMVHILGRICLTENWEFCRYTGEMSHEAREKSILDFGNKAKGKRIMVASLRCGGLGLNLTMASRVITLDPWWNASVEQQAFCRVFRIGQTKETQMTRLVVKGTIDDRIMQMQKTKQEAIDIVMDDKNGKEKLSIAELMQLFGQVGTREGRPFIFAEGHGEEGGRKRDGRKYVDNDFEDEQGHLGEED